LRLIERGNIRENCFNFEHPFIVKIQKEEFIFSNWDQVQWIEQRLKSNETLKEIKDSKSKTFKLNDDEQFHLINQLKGAFIKSPMKSGRD